MESYKKEGRNTFAFWVLIALLLVLTLGNLALTLTIVSVLRRDIELVPEENSIKFKSVDLDRVQKRDGILEGFADVPMTIEGDTLLLNLIYRNGHVHNKLFMGQNETHFRNINHFEVKDPETGAGLFSTSKPTYTLAPGSVKRIQAASTTASRVTSAPGEKLRIETLRGKLVIGGAEGVHLTGREQHWGADQNIHLRAINGSIHLNGSHYILDKIPVMHQLENGIRSAELQYKLCVCQPAGSLYRVMVPRGIHASKITCTHFSPAEFNPCE